MMLQKLARLGVLAGIGMVMALTAGFSSSALADDQLETLLDVYNLAREADPAVRGQDFEVDALREDRRESLGGLLPQLDLSGELTRVNRDQVSAGFAGEEEDERYFTREQYGVNLIQPLFDLPAWYEYQRSGANLDVGEAELEAQRQSLIGRVLEAYLAVLSAQSGVSLAASELEAVEASFRQIEGMYEEGMASITDMEDVRARRDSARAAVIRAEGDLEVARERLSELTGEQHGVLATLSAEAALPGLERHELDQWVQSALEFNPQVVAARLRVESLGYEARATRAQRFPRVEMIAGYSRLDELDGTVYGRDYEDKSVGVRVSVPLYEGGRIGARTRSAENRRSREREALEETVRAVRADARAAFQSLLSGRSQLKAMEQSVRSGERRVEAMEAGVEEGTRPVVDLLDAQRDLFETRRELAEARYDYVVNVIELRRAGGRLSADDVVELNALFDAPVDLPDLTFDQP